LPLYPKLSCLPASSKLVVTHLSALRVLSKTLIAAPTHSFAGHPATLIQPHALKVELPVEVPLAPEFPQVYVSVTLDPSPKVPSLSFSESLVEVEEPLMLQCLKCHPIPPMMNSMTTALQRVASSSKPPMLLEAAGFLP